MPPQTALARALAASCSNRNNGNDLIADDDDSRKMNGGEEPMKVLQTWSLPPAGVTPSPSFGQEMQLLLGCLPKELSEYLQREYTDRLCDINEIYLQLGLLPKVVLGTENDGNVREYLNEYPCMQDHIDLFAQFFGATSESQDGEPRAACMATAKRRGIAKTLHRVSLVTNPTKNPERVIGVAVRVGRSMDGLLETMAWGSFLPDLAKSRQSLLLIGKPGVGKTTVLRQIARTFSENSNLEVVVVDKTCEIAGDGDMPHPAIGQSRWMPVGIPGKQHEIMREAVENQSPDVIIVDEISTMAEVQAARTIAQRGVMLIATVHGATLPELINCKERGTLTGKFLRNAIRIKQRSMIFCFLFSISQILLNNLLYVFSSFVPLGGVTSVTLSGQEAERRFDKRKQVQKRAQEPVFHAALELHTRTKWIFHPSVKEAADAYFEGEPCNAQQLQPGCSVSIASIPGEGTFEYCLACGFGQTCYDHIDGHWSLEESCSTSSGRNNPFQTNNRSNGNAYAAAQPANRTHGRGPNRNKNRANKEQKRPKRAARGSGRCRYCGEFGHYARDCQNY